MGGPLHCLDTVDEYFRRYTNSVNVAQGDYQKGPNIQHVYKHIGSTWQPQRPSARGGVGWAVALAAHAKSSPTRRSFIGPKKLLTRKAVDPAETDSMPGITFAGSVEHSGKTASAFMPVLRRFLKEKDYARSILNGIETPTRMGFWRSGPAILRAVVESWPSIAKGSHI